MRKTVISHQTRTGYFTQHSLAKKETIVAQFNQGGLVDSTWIDLESCIKL